MKSIYSFLILSVCLSYVHIVYADQPVMNEAPRWSGGYGFQVRHEYRESDRLIDKNDEVSNPLGLKRRVNTTWLESVYTWDRSKRITLKVPYVDQMRIANVGGNAITQKERGLGDVIVALPLRKYINHKTWTSNYSLTPNLRLPTGRTSGDYPISDGSTDFGLSLSYGAESAKHLVGVDLFYWVNNKGRRDQHQGNLLGFDVTLGKNIYHDGQKSAGASLQLDFGARYKEEGTSLSGNNAGTSIMLGPAFVYFRGNMIMRIVYSIPVYEHALDRSVSYGHQLDVGIGWSF